MDSKEQKAAHAANLERFENNECRIEKILYLAGMVCDCGTSSAIDDFVDAMCDDVKSMERIFGKTTDALDSILDDNDTQAFADWLFEQGKLGVIVQFATPVMEIGKSHTWGYYTTSWLYGETLEEAIENGFKWVESQRENESKKAAKKAKA